MTISRRRAGRGDNTKRAAIAAARAPVTPKASATIGSSTPGGQAKAEEAPITATANSSRPDASSMARRTRVRMRRVIERSCRRNAVGRADAVEQLGVAGRVLLGLGRDQALDGGAAADQKGLAGQADIGPAGVDPLQRLRLARLDR